MEPVDRPQDSFRYGPEKVASFAERFTVEPVPPGAIRERIDNGDVLATTDVPDYLDRPIACDADTSIALYRLVQLFGTPNVPGLEAGADQPIRHERTWQYLFRVVYRPEAEDGSRPPVGTEDREYLLSVYDFRTNLSVGISEWVGPEGGPRNGVEEPSAEPLPSGSMPDEAMLEMLVQLVLSTVEHVVEATYEDLRV